METSEILEDKGSDGMNRICQQLQLCLCQPQNYHSLDTNVSQKISDQLISDDVEII